LMKQAEKFKRPIITIIDTPGAYPGLGAEERGQAQAIALNLQEMMGLKVPILVIVLSEGGSGGALAIGVGDHVMMFEHSIYSILSPEGFASILFKDAKQAEHAASLMKLTAKDLLDFNVIDEIIPEGTGLHESKEGLFHLKSALSFKMAQIIQEKTSVILQKRYQKYRQMGVFLEGVAIEHTQH
jgi:acetyl-CoA carboxylase carboxyl transferase subunit alpha